MLFLKGTMTIKIKKGIDTFKSLYPTRYSISGLDPNLSLAKHIAACNKICILYYNPVL